VVLTHYARYLIVDVRSFPRNAVHEKSNPGKFACTLSFVQRKVPHRADFSGTMMPQMTRSYACRWIPFTIYAETAKYVLGKKQSQKGYSCLAGHLLREFPPQIKSMIHRAGALTQIQHSGKGTGDVLLGFFDRLIQRVTLSPIGSDGAG